MHYETQLEFLMVENIPITKVGIYQENIAILQLFVLSIFLLFSAPIHIASLFFFVFVSF